MKYKFTKEQFQEAVEKSLSIAQVCRELGIVPVGGNYKTIKSKIKKFNIDISHFTGQAWNQGSRFKCISKKKPLEEILVENSEYTSTNSLKKRLFKENIKMQVCEICGLSEWLNQPISLELNHINGINTDHRLENLQIICPNCHSQTKNYRGRNIKSALSEKREVEYRKFKETPAEMRGNLEPSLINKEGAETLHGKPKSKLKKKCIICEKECRNVYCSYECKNIGASIKIPTYQELINAFNLHKNFLQVGKHFKVSDNAVRKWCIRYGILDMVKKKSSAQTEKSE